MDQTSDMLQAIQQKHGDALTPLGLQLRDTFAAAALTGLLANPETALRISVHITQEAFDLADAMIQARSLKKETQP